MTPEPNEPESTSKTPQVMEIQLRKPQPSDIQGGRVVVVEQVYHQPGKGQPREYPCRFSYRIKADEEPYQRTMKLTFRGVPLDIGWLEDVGVSTVIVSVPSGSPTVTLLIHSHPFAVVHPGESCRFRPVPKMTYFLSAEDGGKATVTVFPE